jgi:hypothetical protein
VNTTFTYIFGINYEGKTEEEGASGFKLIVKYEMVKQIHPLSILKWEHNIKMELGVRANSSYYWAQHRAPVMAVIKFRLQWQAGNTANHPNEY